MNGNEYQQKALRTAGEKAREDLVLNGALGLSGESGEVADHIKKVRFQGHPLDTKVLANELGDIMWYVAIMAEGLGYSLDDIMEMNVEKLKKRYPNGFETERSINRDK